MKTEGRSMIKFVLASRNAHKIAELRTLLSEFLTFDFEILSLDDIGFDGEIEENGTTFEENSLIKASVPAGLGYIGIADDSGLVVDALGGEPGIYSARYAGEPCDNAKNNEKVLEKLKNVPDEKRTARFVCVMSAVFPDGRRFTSRGTVEGRILHELKGTNGFGYDPMFFYEPFGMTLAEVPPEKKNTVSHRYSAVKKFAEKLNEMKENGEI